MATLLKNHPASGGPGIEPRWTRSDKDGVGTAYSDLSRVWFTVSKGILNEIYFPTVDRPQIRDLQYLIRSRDLNEERAAMLKQNSRDAIGVRSPEWRS